ncbi:MAG: sensor histidine kinase, partial [Acidobacteriota bacterium]
EPCPWCKAHDIFGTGSNHREEVELGGQSWEIYWVPIGPDLYLHYAFDITDRKQVEKELRAYAGRLELLNKELQEFAFVASHDLREPLRKIQTFGDKLKFQCKASLDDSGMDSLTRMIRSAGRMSDLLDALLLYSRVTTRERPHVPVDLREIIREAVSDLDVAISEAGGQVNVDELPPPIEGDAVQLRQLFQNLIENSIKYRREDLKPVVTIHGRLEDDICKVFVEDNSIGFEERFIDRIFRPFERLHGQGKYKGTGMGLTIARKIVERHGGTITATSAPGEGATFIVSLPARQGGFEKRAKER